MNITRSFVIFIPSYRACILSNCAFPIRFCVCPIAILFLRCCVYRVNRNASGFLYQEFGGNPETFYFCSYCCFIVYCIFLFVATLCFGHLILNYRFEQKYHYKVFELLAFLIAVFFIYITRSLCFIQQMCPKSIKY